MDIGKLDGMSDEGATLVVKHPGTGEPTDMTITLAGTDSKAWRRAFREARRRSIQSARDSNSTPASVATAVEDAKPDIAASITLDWSNVERDGRQIKFSTDAARLLYTDHPWLLEQVSAFAENRANFFRGDGGGDDGVAQGGGQDEGAPAGSADGN